MEGFQVDLYCFFSVFSSLKRACRVSLFFCLVGDLQSFCKLQYKFLSIVHNLEYAVHADYVHMREYADVDENLIHIIHI